LPPSAISSANPLVSRPTGERRGQTSRGGRDAWPSPPLPGQAPANSEITTRLTATAQLRIAAWRAACSELAGPGSDKEGASVWPKPTCTATSHPQQWLFGRSSARDPLGGYLRERLAGSAAAAATRQQLRAAPAPGSRPPAPGPGHRPEQLLDLPRPAAGRLEGGQLTAPAPRRPGRGPLTPRPSRGVSPRSPHRPYNGARCAGSTESAWAPAGRDTRPDGGAVAGASRFRADVLRFQPV
jgi:hypothetical protein